MGLRGIVCKVAAFAVKAAILLVVPLPVQAQAVGVLSGSEGDSANDLVGFYNILRLPIQKPYLTGLRRDANGTNVCFGVLVSPLHVLTAGCRQTMTPASLTYAVVGSLFDNGTYDKAETIKIRAYKESSNDSTSSYQAVGIYVLESASKAKPIELLSSIALPHSGNVTLPEGTAVTTFGWVNQTQDLLITERTLKLARSSKCETGIEDCVCALASSAQDGCNVPNGSPLITTKNGTDVLLGLRYANTDACDKPGYPLAFTSLAGLPKDWVKG